MSDPEEQTADRPDEGDGGLAGLGVDQVELHYGIATDVGLVREVNEDSCLADPPVFVVADGMGGHDGGDIASRIVVEEFARLADVGLRPRRGSHVVTVDAARLPASAAGVRRDPPRQRRPGAGTAAPRPWSRSWSRSDDGPQWLLVNLGDSRIYRFTTAS